MQRYKSLVLPAALILGYIFRRECAVMSVSVPYVIFGILVFTFSGVRLSSLRPSRLDLWIALFQTVVSASVYLLAMALTSNEIISQGTMMCVLCPIASSVTVVATMLGANAARTATYTIVGNLLVALIAPIFISFIADAPDNADIIHTFPPIFCKVASVIALPFIVMWLLQRLAPQANAWLANYKQLSFYLWAYALLVTIGQTADFVFMHLHDNLRPVAWLGATSLTVCAAQFAIGKRIGARYGDRVAGGQLLAQKNSAMGIWLLNSFLNPVASVGMAFYSIWQNVYNSWQIYRASR